MSNSDYTFLEEYMRENKGQVDVSFDSHINLFEIYDYIKNESWTGETLSEASQKLQDTLDRMTREDA